MAGKAQGVFENAVELTGGEREAYLRGACGTDGPLRAEVDSLLRAFDRGAGFLAAPTAALQGHVDAAETIVAPIREGPGTRIGRYKLLQLIGEGGFGSVFMAEQEKPVSRKVALKIIKLGMDTRAVIARFEAERQALALMDHPNIARVLDAGATETGRPYFVMELCKGEPIVEYCDRNNLSIAERLELFDQVCTAVQHAHTKGIIHRDIKPSNILVSTQDGRPHAKVIDFGIAKATASRLTEKTLFTEHKALIGTPEYMSPEQAEGSLDIDTRTDVYSLGVLLYELLTGTTPFSSKDLRSVAYAEIQRIIREVEPPKPSTRLSSNANTLASVASQRHTEPKKLGTLIRGELDWIVMKALEKDRSRRYETAKGLAVDIRRYLSGEAVLAAPPSTAYRIRKFVRRNRGPVVAASLVLAALLAASVGTAWGLVQTNRARSIGLRQELENQQRTAADNARFDRNAEAVGALLSQGEEALRAGDAAKAGIALDAAKRRSAEGGSEKDTERLSHLSADLELLAELDAIDQFRWAWPEDSISCMKIAMPRMREALKKFGADPEAAGGSVESAAAAVNASAVRERIVAALDWVLWSWKSSDGVSALLRRLDDDPFRNEFRDALRTNTESFVEVAERPAALEQPSGFAAFMGEFKPIDRARRMELLQAAALRRPRDVELLMTLGRLCLGSDAHEDLRWYQAAVAADPNNPGVYNNLGVGLKVAGRPLDAIACYHRAIELDPKHSSAYVNLGNALEDIGQSEEGLASHLKAVELSPNDFECYCTLGNSLGKLGRMEEGIRALKKSIELNPTHAESRYNLGLLLGQAGRWAEAMESLRKAIEINPNSSDTYGNMGVALRNQGRLNEAVGYFEKAIELNPKSARYQSSLGGVLGDLGRHDEAIALCKKAIESDPKYAMAYYNLGSTYSAQGLFDDAIPTFRKTIELDPRYAEAHCNLAQALVNQGHYEEGLAEYKKGHELGSARPDWHYPSAQWIRDAEANIALAARLPSLLKGEYQPTDNAQRLELALICQNKKLNYAAAGLYVAGLAADPKTAGNVEGCVRYNAACVAALSAAGQGEDAANLGDDERVRLRRRALDWLRADLNVATRRLGSSTTPTDAWSRWFCAHSLNKNPDLVSVRDPAALAKLPAEEQEAFRQLWADMAALLKTAQAPTPDAAQPGASPVEKVDHP